MEKFFRLPFGHMLLSSLLSGGTPVLSFPGIMGTHPSAALTLLHPPHHGIQACHISYLCAAGASSNPLLCLLLCSSSLFKSGSPNLPFVQLLLGLPGPTLPPLWPSPCFPLACPSALFSSHLPPQDDPYLFLALHLC